jgi:hypothetical protein
VLVVGAGRPACRRRAPGAGRRRRDRADERLHPGGQFFKPLAPSHRPRRRRSTASSATAPVLAQSALAAGARIVNEATVWAAFSPHEVAALVAGQSTLCRPRRLVLATGAYEQSPTIPGWTLPGVMTVGGLQTLARSTAWRRAHASSSQATARSACRPPAELLDGGANVGGRARGGAASRTGALAGAGERGIGRSLS